MNVFNKNNFAEFIKKILDMNSKLNDIHYRKKIYYIKYIVLDNLFDVTNQDNTNIINNEVSIIDNVSEPNSYTNIIQITQYIYKENYVKNYEYIHYVNQSIQQIKQYLDNNMSTINKQFEYYRNLFLNEIELRILYLNDLYQIQNIFDKITYNYYNIFINDTFLMDIQHC